MSVRGINKVRRELGFVLMALNIRKVVAQRDENNKNKSKPPVHTGGFDLSKYLFKIRIPLFLILNEHFKELRVFYIVLCLNNYINS